MKANQSLRNLIRQLGAVHSPVCISIYSPLDYDSPDALNANKIRIKNIASEIKQHVETNSSLKVSDIDEYLNPLYELMDSRGSMWQRDAKSLAVFANEKFITYQFLPVEQKRKQSVISNTFLVEPLRRLVKDNPSFYILSASHNEVTLYRGDQFQLEPVSLSSLPNQSAEELLNIDEYPQTQQFHPATTAGAKIGKRSYREQFHGQYNAVEVDRNILRKYFHRVNEAVANFLKKEKSNTPLIFAGVNYLFPLYKQANSYSNLLSQHIEGNFQHGNEQELHKRALSIV